jgi:uncharacterized protein YhdP
MAPPLETLSSSVAPVRSWFRVALLSSLGVGAVCAFVLFAYELALAQVPHHRAALERLVRAETGLDVRFNELGLRWGWYGPEAVFRRVELDQPGSAAALLRAPELVVGFDAWRTLRSGHPEAGRIELVSPDIDFAGVVRGQEGIPRASPVPRSMGPAGAVKAPTLDRVAVLQGWRGGRIDIEGGTLRLPDPSSPAGSFTLQLQRASLRRSDDEWSVFGLVFLPDRVGRTARVVMRVNGDLAKPDALSGSLRLEARRLLFPGCRDFLASVPDLANYLPRSGNGDLTLDLDFERGRIVKAGGNIHAGRLVFDARSNPSSGDTAPGAAPPHANVLVLNRLRGDWRAARHGSQWRIRVDSLELAKGARPASLTFDAGESSVAPGQAASHWVRGNLEEAPVESVVALARWLSPSLDLAGTDIDGAARNVTFDWASGRPEGQRLQASARFEDVSLVPRSQDFTLSGLNVRIAGSESRLTVDVQSHAARLELAQSRQYPLANIRVSSTLLISGTAAGWRIATDGFLLEQQRTTLSLSGELHGDAAIDAAVEPPEPEIVARGSLTGADIPFVERLLGENTAQAFGAAASRLTAGNIQNAQFELHGPISQLPFGGSGGFTGSLTLRDAILSGGDLWPDAQGVDARVEWHGARIQATIDAGHAGPFKFGAASAQWDAAGQSATRLTGQIDGRLEDAIAWIHDHPRLQEYAPDVQDIDASGKAAFDFNVSVPPGVNAAGQPQVTARVATVIDGAKLQAVAGLPPMEGISGAFVFDAGRVQHTTLTGTWLGGPVILRVGERREKGLRVFAVQAQGVLNAQQLANLANAPGTVQGSTDWAGELVYVPASNTQPARWRMKADSSLVGLVSSLPEPLEKRSSMAVPAHLEVAGTDTAAQMQANLGDRIRSSFALKRRPDVGWTVDRGAVRFGAATLAVPSEPVVLIRGRINQLDLPAYVMAWQRLRRDSLPTIRAQMVAGRMSVAGRSYAEVSLEAERTATATELRIESADIAGIARWPTGSDAAHAAAAGVAQQPAELRFARLDLSDEAIPGESVGLIAGLAPASVVSVDELRWRGRLLGRLSATVAAEGTVMSVEEARLVSDTSEAHGSLRCEAQSPACLLSFSVDSSDVAATLEDFGFAPDVAAARGSFVGELEWQQPVGQQPSLASLRGTLSMRLADGTLLAGTEDRTERPFALLAVPALVDALNEPGAVSAPLARSHRELQFASLEADFDVRDGQATTSNLHFDGDAEILMRGRIGLVSRDYDQQVWVLRGEERLPAAVRRFGATPRVAAAWLSLRDLLSGSANPDRPAAVLRLQGSWNDPIVVAAK